MDSILRMIGSRFSDVDHISTSTLAEWLVQHSEPPPSHSQMSQSDIKDVPVSESTCEKSEDSIPMQQNVVLLDARDEKEFAVSHLENAIWVGEKPSENQVTDLVKDFLKLDEKDELKEKVETSSDPSVPDGGSSYDLGRSVRFVCYCALGYRSSQLAQKMQVALETVNFPVGASVHNLEGSIIKWANEGRPMVDNGGNPTKFCHPYNTVFGLTLNKELRKYE